MFQVTKFPTILFYAFLSLIFLFEGLGWRGGREASFALILVMPLFLFILDFIFNRPIAIPKISTILYGGFIFFSTISTIFSVDIQRSLPYLLFYIALYGVFLYVYNHQEEIKRYLIPFIFIVSFIFSVYSLCMNFLISLDIPFLIPEWGYQYVFSMFGSHNHLGNLLLIPLVISVYKFLSGRKSLQYVLTFLYFLPFFIFSYSRSAYLSFITTITLLLLYLAIKQKDVTGRKILGLGAIILGVTFLFFATTKEYRDISFYQPVSSYLRNQQGLTSKLFFGNRNVYFYDSFKAIVEKPLVGVGPDNYINVSGKYTDLSGSKTETSHNIFLDILSENGVVAGIFFILFLTYVFLKQKNTMFFFVGITMLINFQTIYSFKIYSYLFFFFLVISLSCHPLIQKKENGE